MGIKIWNTDISKMYVYVYETVHVTGVTLNKNTLVLDTVWQTEQLTATITPANADDQTVVWSTSDSSVATVDQTWLVTCVTPWDATITVTTNDGWYTATCSVSDHAWWYTPTANTLWYLNLNQSDAVFTDTQWHTVTNNGIVYDASGIYEWCGYNNSDWKRLYSDFDGWESFPAQFTIMAFMKPTGNHYTGDHPMWISLANATTKVTCGIWFTQYNTQVQFNHLREWIAWDTSSYSSVIILNTWHHYALTYDGSTVKGYIDWSQVVSFSASGSGSWTWPSWWLTVFWRNHPGFTNTIQWYVDEAICEDKLWTASDIQTYLSDYTY